VRAFIEAVVDFLADVLCSGGNGLVGSVIFGLLGVDVLTRPGRGTGVLVSDMRLMLGSALLEGGVVVRVVGRDSFLFTDVGAM